MKEAFGLLNEGMKLIDDWFLGMAKHIAECRTLDVFRKINLFLNDDVRPDHIVASSEDLH